MHDVLIIGAGPAGLSAALWCDELGLDTLVLEQNEEVGGQLLSVHHPVVNYLGVQAANGRELRDRFVEQTKDCDFDLWTKVEIDSVDLRAKRINLRTGENLQAIAMIIATGLRRRQLGIPGETDFEGHGIIESGARDRNPTKHRAISESVRNGCPRLRDCLLAAGNECGKRVCNW